MTKWNLVAMGQVGLTGYRQAMRDFAKMTNLDVWYAHADLDQLKAQFASQMKARQRKMVDKGIAKARTRDSMQEVAKLTHLVDGLAADHRGPAADRPVRGPAAQQTDRSCIEAPVADLVGQYRRTLETDRRYQHEQNHTRAWPARSSESAASGPAAGSC